MEAELEESMPIGVEHIIENEPGEQCRSRGKGSAQTKCLGVLQPSNSRNFLGV